MASRALFLAVAVGPLTPYWTASATIGGDPPAKVLIFPRDVWPLADGDSLITDAESFQSILANFRERGILIVFDYEHMTIDEYRKPGELPIAAGFITDLEVTAQGLVGSVTWTPRAAAHIAAGEYLYHSPVAIYDKATLRVIALHSCALTNTPRTNYQKPITEQVAARIIDACWPDAKGGEQRMKWTELLTQFLAARMDSPADEKIAALKAVIESLTASGADAVAASSEGESILSHLQLVQRDNVPAAAEPIAAALGLEVDAKADALVARINEMKTGVVAKADHDAAIATLTATVADLTARLEASNPNDVESLIATNLDKLSPALRQNIRAVAKTNKTLAVEMIANITGTRTATTIPAPIAGRDSAGAPSANVTEIATHREWRGEVLPVSESSGAMAAAIRAIQDAEGCDYAEATSRYHKKTGAKIAA